MKTRSCLVSGSLPWGKIDPFYSKLKDFYDKPLVFAIDTRNGVKADEVKNDDQYTDEEAREYFQSEDYKYNPDCGCNLSRCKKDCCHGSGCYDACGCLCLKDEYFDPYAATCCPPRAVGGWKGADILHYGPYIKQITRSDGFDLEVDYEPKFGFLTATPEFYRSPLDEMTPDERDLVKKLAVLAIKRYNKVHNTNFRCLSFVKANQAGIRTHYITFVAADDEGNGEPLYFQAIVLDDYAGSSQKIKFMREVLFCRIRPSQVLPPVWDDEAETKKEAKRLLLIKEERAKAKRSREVDVAGEVIDAEKPVVAASSSERAT